MHPPGRARVQLFEEIEELLTTGAVNLVVLACVLRATTRKGRQVFFRNKSTPSEKILATPMISAFFVTVRAGTAYRKI